VTGQHSNQLNYRSATWWFTYNRSGSVQEYSKNSKGVSLQQKKTSIPH